ncbi:MAG: DUF1508 domain-containing protein [Haloferacaceae archaeon]
MTVTPVPADRDGRLLRQPYYELRRARGGWRWRLFGSDDGVLAESSVAFANRAAARNALDELSAAAPIAGTEVTISEEA